MCSSDLFREGMRERGYVEGKTYALEIRNAEAQRERLPALAADLIRLNVDVMVATSSDGTDAAIKATKTIPVVFGASADPVARGLVQSLARPGGNVTGTSYQYSDFAAKQVELLKMIVPKLSRAALVRVQTGSSPAPFLEPMISAARKMGITIKDQPLADADAETIEAMFETMRRDGIQGFILAPHPLLGSRFATLAALTLKYRIPSLVPYPEVTRNGGLMSFFPSVQESHKRMAYYVDRILKGAKPADLPVEQPTKFHMAVNTKTARLLGLSVPREILVRAEEVIE